MVVFANPNSQTYSGVISGSGSVSKSGAGILTLDGTSSFSGGTTITEGTLALGHATDTLRDSGAVTVNGGTLALGANSDTVGAVTLSSGSITGSGGTLTGTSYAVNNTTGTTAISANLGGAGVLTKSNAGNLTLSGTNAYSGGTVLNGGTTSVASNANLGDSAGALTFGGGTLALTGAIAASRTLTVGTSGGTIATGGNNFSNSGAATINGTLSITGSGDVAFTGSSLTFGSAGALSIASGGTATIAGSYSTINMANGGTFDGDLILNTTARINLNGNTKTYGGAGDIKILGSALGAGSGGLAVPGTGFTGFNALISNTSGQTAGTISSDIVLNPTGTGHVAFTAGDITTATYTTASYLAFIGGTSGATGDGIVVNGKITGDGDLFIGNNSKTGGGGGNLTLNSANDYAGNTLINAGNGAVIKLGTTNALPTATNVVFGSLVGSGAPILDVNGFSQQIASLSDGGQQSGSKFLTIRNNGAVDATLTINGSTTPFGTFGGVIADGTTNKIALVKDGSNTINLAGVNTFTGGTTITGGTLKLGSGNILADTGAVLINGGILDLQADNETVGAFTISSGSVIGTGILTASSYNIQGGTLGALLGGSAAVSITSGGTLGFSGSTPTTYTNAVTIGSGNGTISNTGSGALTLTGGINKTGTVLTLSGTSASNVININTVGITGVTGSFNSDLVVSAVTVNQNVANDYFGPTFIRNGGVLNANVTDALPTASGRTSVDLDDTGSGNSTLALGANQQAASLSGATTSSVILGANSLTVGTTSGNTTFAGEISGSGGSLIKDGASTLTLSNLNTYTGGTTVDGGNLNVTNGSGSATGTDSVTINTGGTLSGTGKIDAGANSISFIGGSLVVGNSTLGLPVASSFDLKTSGGGSTVLGVNSAIYLDLFANVGNNISNTAAADYVRLFGAVNVDPSASLYITDSTGLMTFNTGDRWLIGDLTGLGTLTGSLGFASIFGPTLGVGQSWQTAQVGNNWELSITAVPEPSRALLLGFGLLGLLFRRRRSSRVA